MDAKEIPVGSYVHIKNWKKGDKLWSDWIEDDPEYSAHIKDLNPEEKILDAGKYILKIDYPLSIPFIEERVLDKPMTREEVVDWIVDRYHFIYDVEKDTGTFGIWGHAIEDLDLHTIFIDKNGLITLGVDS